MISEKSGKTSGSGSNLNDKSEYNLTGNVFGFLRYIPFSEAMKQIILILICLKEIADTINEI